MITLMETDIRKDLLENILNIFRNSVDELVEKQEPCSSKVTSDEEYKRLQSLSLLAIDVSNDLIKQYELTEEEQEVLKVNILFTLVGIGV